MTKKSESALNWVRENCQRKDQDAWTTDEGVRIETKSNMYHGRVPGHMVKALQGAHKFLEKSDEVNEVLRIGGQYRSDWNYVEFTRTEYKVSESI